MPRQKENHNAPVVASPTATLKALHDVAEAGIDPLGMAAPLGHAQIAWMTHPLELAELGARFSGDLMAFTWHAWNRALGLPGEDPILPHADDTRFSDPVWKDSARPSPISRLNTSKRRRCTASASSISTARS